MNWSSNASKRAGGGIVKIICDDVNKKPVIGNIDSFFEVGSKYEVGNNNERSK